MTENTPADSPRFLPRDSQMRIAFSELSVQLEISGSGQLYGVSCAANLILLYRAFIHDRSGKRTAVAYGGAFTVPQSLLQQYFLRLDRDEEVGKPAGGDPTPSGMFLPAFQDLAACNQDLLLRSPLESPEMLRPA